MGEPELDPYAVLEVSRSATIREIRAAYRALGARYHPDRHQGNPLEELAAARMVEINRAYELLSDAKRRAEFDAGSTQSARYRAATAERATGKRFLKVAALLMLLPLILRAGRSIFRAAGLLVVRGFEAVALLRGPRLAAALALVAVVVLGFALRRRRRLGPR
jgi:curved DNA-binding protein CbpA